MSEIRGTVDDAACVAGVLPSTVRQWAYRGHISRPVGGLWDLAEVAAWSDMRGVAQWGRALSARKRRGETRQRQTDSPDRAVGSPTCARR